ncbi:MAG: sigma-54-dependent Fis family transcriptional regulator, partial [Myxococcales bacterium]|nr:sigma-54-dependent Fis family transcriptional regulator [Myxococcales bacterium]
DVDVRVVCATHQDLTGLMKTGGFREDLFYRISEVTLNIPPLRERTAEIPALAGLFIDEAARDAGLHEGAPVLSSDAERWLVRYAWPGSIRELRNAIGRAVILATAGLIEPEHLQPESYQPRTGRGSGRPAASLPAPEVQAPVDDGPPPDLSEADLAERQRIIDALAACGGNQTRAAKLLGITRRMLISRLERYDIPRPRAKRRGED